MGKDSKIPWCHHTFNPWWGCTKVSPGCTNCYAEVGARRWGTWWGADAPRRMFGDKHWAEPLRWDRVAAAAGERHRVFAGSYCDVFEARGDVGDERNRLLELIQGTPNLDWLLLTKRPDGAALYSYELSTLPNVWLGVTAENQEQADARIPVLLDIPVAVRFVSIEPLLGPVLLDNGSSSWLSCDGRAREGNDGHCCESEFVHGEHFHGIDWVIVGDESGPRRRRAGMQWAISLFRQCGEAGVPFFFKQWHLDDKKVETPLLLGEQRIAFPEAG